MGIRSDALVYLERAEAFFRSAQLLGEDPPDRDYAPAVGLLAVHSGISLADALLVAFDDGRSKADDHRQVAAMLEKLCAAKRLKKAGVKHLRELIGYKSKFSYGASVVQDQEFQRARLRMEQFFKWAYDTFPTIAQTERNPDDQQV